ncbi:hypothetical protein [Deinococcus budaensis]|uniref:Periplasmic heavy metal sensor n=1 Tax=Deinococcus budaensis TaxID=1665626 RepID=A0A7W8GBV1_9DEIO|nr:hypothetical protein [Deinococcus budaensis]MBB5232632.1 hypothetical protein [Deinococcus budaensis]
MKWRPPRARMALALLGLAALTPAGGRAAPAPWPGDPWPGSPALIRLYLLPAGRADGERLARDLALRPEQVAELRELARTEAAAGQAGRQVIGRAEAARFNAELAALRAEKDRRVRAALGEQYPAFRAWLSGWWAEQVSAARQRVR